MKSALAAALAMAVLTPGLAQAQAGGVPPYEPPPPVAIKRDGEMMTPPAPAFGAGDKGEATAAMLANFASAYQAHGKPRLALYWNRQLSEALNDWYSPVRVVNREDTNSSMTGEINLTQSGSTQNTMEVQQRVRDARRAQTRESFEWEFQDGFLNPFLEAGVEVIDRTAMMRLTGVDMDGTGERIVEMKALQGKADMLMEVLVAGNWRSTTGYELRARILDVKTGRIVAYVNSKGLKNWNPPKEILVTEQGFVDPEDMDDEDENFGPIGEEKVRLTAKGASIRRKPPKLQKIAHNLAYNVMDGLMKQWK